MFYEGFDVVEAQNNAIKRVQEVDKEIQKEISKGSMSDEHKITKLRFEQMLRGLFITQDPLNLN